MKKIEQKLRILLLAVAIIGLQSCQKADDFDSVNENISELKKATVNNFYSSTLPVGNGVVRAYVTENRDGDPVEVGINLSAKVLDNLPDEPKQYVLELPKNKGNHFYTHVLFDWNPMGHEPPGIYDLPHFDIHFYIIPNEERLAIPGLSPPDKDDAPGNDYIPEFYMQLEGVVPQMGAHWIDVRSPELGGETFTKTFIWGSYDAEFIFWEPMITRDYLMTMPDEIIPIPQPIAYQESGWYPTDYKISYSPTKKQYTIALVNLMYHDAE